MTDHDDVWGRGLDNETLATGVRSLATKIPPRDRTDEALALIREAARRIEAAGAIVPLDPTPNELRYLAEIMDTNSDQRGFDFWSALSAMEAERLD